MQVRVNTEELVRTENLVKWAIQELCAGRTFYNDYFKGVDYSTMSRIDRALFILSQIENTSALGTPCNIPARLKNIIEDVSVPELKDLKGEKNEQK